LDEPGGDVRVLIGVAGSARAARRGERDVDGAGPGRGGGRELGGTVGTEVACGGAPELDVRGARKIGASDRDGGPAGLRPGCRADLGDRGGGDVGVEVGAAGGARAAW